MIALRWLGRFLGSVGYVGALPIGGASTLAVLLSVVLYFLAAQALFNPSVELVAIVGGLLFVFSIALSTLWERIAEDKPNGFMVHVLLSTLLLGWGVSQYYSLNSEVLFLALVLYRFLAVVRPLPLSFLSTDHGLWRTASELICAAAAFGLTLLLGYCYELILPFITV